MRVGVYGTVDPASKGKSVRLQRKSGGSWHTVATATIKKQKMPSGSTEVGFSLSWKATTKGKSYLRVELPAGSSYGAGTSSDLVVKVT